MKVAVVGAGIHGTCAAWRLAQRGHAVSVFEQFEANHHRGSSHGRTRIVRQAYPDAFHVRLLLEGHPMWSELEADSGERLVEPVGLMYFGKTVSPAIISGEQALSELGVPHEVLDSKNVHNRFPRLRLADDEVGIFSPEAGWVRADSAIAAARRLAEAKGAQFHFGIRSDCETLEKDFDAVVLAPGAWISEVVDVPVTATIQNFAYFPLEVEGPVWIEDGPDLIYGFPTEPGDHRFKVGVHFPGPEVDLSSTDRPVNPVAIAKMQDFAARRFGVSDLEPEDITGCIYTFTSDERFRFGRLSPKTVWVTACSGHGFKFGPWVGKCLSDLAEGGTLPSAAAELWHSG